jgi:hypothetical protein
MGFVVRSMRFRYEVRGKGAPMEMKPHALPLKQERKRSARILRAGHADVKGGFHGRGFVIKRILHAPPPL